MAALRLREWVRALGRVEKAFLFGLALYAGLRFWAAASGFAALLAFVLYFLGIIVFVRAARPVLGKAIWRLRNRLIIAYLFIALVPIVLMAALVGLTTYWITGQFAGYLVDAELNRRTAGLRRPAEALARVTPARREDLVRGMFPFLANAFPDLELLVVMPGETYHFPPESDLTPPPGEAKETHGVVSRDGRLYSWALAIHGDTRVVLASPLSRDFLNELVPALGNVSLLASPVVPSPERQGARLAVNGKTVRFQEPRGQEPRSRRKDHTPTAYNSADIVVTGYYPIPIARWDNPALSEDGMLVVQTRTSAVLGLVFGHNVIGEKMEWGQVIWWGFLTVSGLFLVVELISLVIGISLSRTITTAVHELYTGTQRVMEGDFSHRIPVRGKDQLAELGVSFNTMTANLERLIVVAKEKERLQSELEIAREVQNQLFPKEAPGLPTLQVTGVCNPARMVSGDYYDFMCLPDATLAFAIGDVAGKGISAALLMAAIQSTMRTQINAGAPLAAAAGNGGGNGHISTARLVSTLNKQLYANTSPEKYATFYFGIYDDNNSILTYTNAGHLQPILLRAGGSQLLEVTGTVVGAFPFSIYEEKSIRLASGDVLVAYTDGIVEPENEYGEMFGEERLTELLLKNAGCEGAEIIARTMEAVEQWTGAGELQDDMTMLVALRL